MVTRFTLAFTMALLAVGSAVAQTQVIVQDDFEGYADTAAFLEQWVPTSGGGTAPLPTSDQSYLAGVLTSDPFSNPDNFPGVEGVGVDHLGAAPSPAPTMVNQWGGAFDPVTGGTPAFQIAPSTTQSVHLSVDIFMGNSGNERMSLGLRNIGPDGSDPDALADTVNLLELGAWNADPTVLGIEGTEQVSANFAFRVILFGPASAPLPGQPNWQYFKLPTELDRVDDADEIVNVSDVGAGWHTYSATMSPTEITLSIDLFRDGFKNIRDENGDIVAGTEAGPDAELTLPVATLPIGFNSLRMGGPSGVSSPGAGAMGFDNVLLQLVEAAAPTDDADFDGDGDVDGADFLTWQRNLGTNNAAGDADGNGTVETADLDVWKQQFSAGAGAAPAVAAIPEPTTIALGALAVLAGLAASRRRA